MIDVSESGPREGYAISTLSEMGEGYGFRKIRPAVGVTAFGINAIVLPAGYETAMHYHDEQEETYFVHQGEVEFRFHSNLFALGAAISLIALVVLGVGVAVRR